MSKRIDHQRIAGFWGLEKLCEIHLDGNKLSVSDAKYKWLITEPIFGSDGTPYDPEKDPEGFFEHLPEMYHGTYFVEIAQ